MDGVNAVGSEEPPGERPENTRTYRILAGEAHSWSALLLEDDHAQRYLYLVTDGTLEPVVPEFATSLLEGREFRPWRGRQDLQPLSDLPIVPEKHRTPSWLTKSIVQPEPVLEEGEGLHT